MSAKRQTNRNTGLRRISPAEAAGSAGEPEGSAPGDDDPPAGSWSQPQAGQKRTPDCSSVPHARQKRLNYGSLGILKITRVPKPSAAGSSSRAATTSPRDSS